MSKLEEIGVSVYTSTDDFPNFGNQVGIADGVLQARTTDGRKSIGVSLVNSISEIPANANGVYRPPSGELLSYVNGVSVSGFTGNGIFNFNRSYYEKLTKKLVGVLEGTSNARILMVGDSTTSGQYPSAVSNQTSQSIITKISRLLTSRGIKGSWQSVCGFVSHFSTGNLLTPNSYDNRVLDLPAGWVLFDASTSIGCSIVNNTSTLNPITFTPTVQTDTIDVYFYNAVGYNAFTVNNGASIIGTAVPAATGISKLTCPTTLGSNTYTIQRTATGTSCYIIGVEAYNSAEKEVTLINAGFGGALIDSFFAKVPTQPWHTLNQLIDPDFKPDLLAINFGTNHWSNYLTRPVAAFEASLNYAVNFLITNGVPVLLIIPPLSPDSVVLESIQLQYIAAIKRTAETYNISALDFSAVFVNNPTSITNGYMVLADVHPTTLGYTKEATCFANFIEALL